MAARWLQIVRMRVRALVRGRQLDRDLEEELRDHVAHQTAVNIERGIPPDEARRLALAALGGLQPQRERCRDARGWRWLTDVAQDLRYASRAFARTPAFSVAAVLTIALGIGATTAIFSVVRAVILEPLPYGQPDRLVHLYERVPGAATAARRRGSMAVAELRELALRSRTLSGVGASGLSLVTMVGAREPAQVWGAPLLPGTLNTLGVRPALGRWFSEMDAGASDQAVLLSDAAWRRYFGADVDVLGQTITFQGSSTFVDGIQLGVRYTIVGVMPRAFYYPDERTEFWVLSAGAGSSRLSAIARLADGMSPQAAGAEASAIVAAVRGATSASPGGVPRVEAVRIGDEMSAPVTPALLVLTAAVMLLLVIACANVTSLLLMRSTANTRAVAVRLALGAGRARIVRQALTESVLLAAAGGAVGIGFARAGIDLFRALAANLSRFDLGSRAVFPRLDAIGIDPVVLAFAAALTGTAGALVGIAAARRQAAARAMDLLREALPISAGFSLTRRSAQGVLIVAQIAMATMLFVTSALLVRGFTNLLHVDPGYDPAGVVTFQVSVPGEQRTGALLAEFADSLVARLRVLPGVKQAAYARQLPMVVLEDSYHVAATPGAPPSEATLSDARFVSRGYLDAMCIRIVAGRGLGPDRAAAAHAIVLSRALAHRAFGSGDAVGRQVYVGGSPTPWRVVGVADDVRQFALDRPAEPQMFADIHEWSGKNQFPIGPYYVVRIRGPLAPVIQAVRSIAGQLDRQAAVYNIATMDRIVSNSLTLPRLYAVLMGVFATVAVMLALIGIYGVVGYAVERRTGEIGLRVALGATRAHVIGLVVGQVGVLTGTGIVVGLLSASVLTPYLDALLYGLPAVDPATFASVAAVFALSAAVSAYLPARRALAVDPLSALRQG